MTSLGSLRGFALSIMAKCVRWVHSHTVTEVLDRTSFLVQPLSDHCPTLRMLLPSELGRSGIPHKAIGLRIGRPTQLIAGVY